MKGIGLEVLFMSEARKEKSRTTYRSSFISIKTDHESISRTFLKGVVGIGATMGESIADLARIFSDVPQDFPECGEHKTKFVGKFLLSERGGVFYTKIINLFCIDEFEYIATNGALETEGETPEESLGKFSVHLDDKLRVASSILAPGRSCRIRGQNIEPIVSGTRRKI